MAWGNPSFLYPIWNNVPFDEEIDHLPGDYKHGSDESLKEMIKELHEKVHGLDDDYNIVVGNGATQLIIAALACLEAADTDSGLRVVAERPYYSRIPDMVRIAGSRFTTEIPNTQIVTSPNNPTGEHQTASKLKSIKYVLHDYSYNWPTYTDTLEPLDKNIMFFSLAKTTGHADMRIGWALVKSNELAAQMEAYIELSTMGVSKQSQQAAYNVLSVVSDYYVDFFKGAKEKLDGRWKKVSKLKLPFKILNSSGMFAWIEGTPPEDILVMDGCKFGVGQQGKFRINMGCDDATFKAFTQKF